MNDGLLIAVVTCQANKDRADIQRQTWAKDAAAIGIDVRFFVGRPEEPIAGNGKDVFELDDTVFLPVPDDYAHLREKVQLMFGWAVRHGYSWILKTDDDALVIPQNITIDLEKPYVGRYRLPSGTWKEPNGLPTGWEIYGAKEQPFCSGLGYVLNRKAAAIVADAKDNGDWAEDRFVGQALAPHFIRPQMDYRYIFWPYDFGRVEYYDQAIDRRVIVACQHGYKEGLIERLYEEYHKTGRLPRK